MFKLFKKKSADFSDIRESTDSSYENEIGYDSKSKLNRKTVSASILKPRTLNISAVSNFDNSSNVLKNAKLVPQKNDSGISKSVKSPSNIDYLVKPTLPRPKSATKHTILDDRFETPRSIYGTENQKFYPKRTPVTLSRPNSMKSPPGSMLNENNSETQQVQEPQSPLEDEMYVYEDEEDIDQVEYVFSKVRHNRIELVKESLEQGFDPCSVDDKGNTMLHICCQNNHRKLASVVLKAGCPAEDMNDKGLTPLDFCKLYQFHELSLWLVKKIEKINQSLPDEHAQYDDDSVSARSNRTNTSTYSEKHSAMGQLRRNSDSRVHQKYNSDPRFSMR